MRIRISYVLVCLLTCSFLFVTCGKKAKLEKLTGTWDLVYGAYQKPANSWTFDSDNIIYRTFSDTAIDTDTGTYNLFGDFPNGYYMDLKNISPFLDGQYKILTLSKKLLVLEQITNRDGDGAYGRLEFTPKN